MEVDNGKHQEKFELYRHNSYLCSICAQSDLAVQKNVPLHLVHFGHRVAFGLHHPESFSSQTGLKA
jgi:hypothetical protein